MSKEHPTAWYWTCGYCGKRAYPTRRAAKAAAREVQRTQAHDTSRDVPVSVYRCRGDDSCFHWGHDGDRARRVLEEERIARTGSKRAASDTTAPRHVAMREEKR